MISSSLQKIILDINQKVKEEDKMTKPIKILIGIGALALGIFVILKAKSFGKKADKQSEDSTKEPPKETTKTAYGTEYYKNSGIGVSNDGMKITKTLPDGSKITRDLSEYPPEVLAQLKKRASMPRKPLQ